MSHRNLAGQRLLVLSMLGWALFNYPLLALLEGAGRWLGMPAMLVYVFAVWGLLIALMARVAEGAQRKPAPPGSGGAAASSGSSGSFRASA